MYDYSKIKYLYPHEKEALFRAIEVDNSKYHIRNKAIFYLAEYAGLRASEVGLIQVADINPDTNEIFFRRLKNSKSNRLRIIDNVVVSALQDYLDYRRGNDIHSNFLFPSQKGTPISRKTLDQMIKAYCSLASLPDDKAHFHVLKHTRAVELADLGLDTKEVQFWIGHCNIANTEIYLQFTTTQQNALYLKMERLRTLPQPKTGSGIENSLKI